MRSNRFGLPALVPVLALIVLLLSALSAGLFFGCSTAEESSSGNINVIVILADTLRADRLGFEGADRPTSPNLDRIASESLVFTQARSQAGCTYPSVNSLLTSRYPYRFLGQDEARMSIPSEIPTLPEILKAHGYSTAAVSASAIVRRTPSRMNPVGGFGAGFDVFDESCVSQDASCVNAQAFERLEELASSESPFFLYLHYMDPHAPYRPPETFERHFGSSRGETTQGWAQNGNTMPLIRKIYDGAGGIEVTERDIDQMRALYDEEIRYLDSQLGLLFDDLKQRGLDRNTLVVFLSDHGEELMEHGEIAHCRNLTYDTVIRTPLLFRFPGASTSGRLAVGAQNLDVLPTVLDFLAIEEPDGLEGRSLLRAISDPGSRRINRYQFMFQGAARAASDGRYKLIYDLESGDEQLFDLRMDPEEMVNRIDQQPEEAERLRRTLFAWIEAMEGSVGSERSLQDAEESLKKLKALGYL